MERVDGRLLRRGRRRRRRRREPDRRLGPARAVRPRRRARRRARGRQPAGRRHAAARRAPLRVSARDPARRRRRGLVPAARRRRARAGGDRLRRRRRGAATPTSSSTRSREHRPDVVVTDIRMPPTNTDEGLRAAAVIRAELPRTGVLVLSQYVNERYALQLLGDERRRRRLPAQGPRAGAARLRRRGPGGRAAAAPRSTRRSSRRCSSAAGRAGRSTRSRRASATSWRAWPRARRNRAIAAGLDLSEHTLARDLTSIFEKLGAARATPRATAACSPSSPTCARSERAAPHLGRAPRPGRAGPRQRTSGRSTTFTAIYTRTGGPAARRAPRVSVRAL